MPKGRREKKKMDINRKLFFILLVFAVALLVSYTLVWYNTQRHKKKFLFYKAKLSKYGKVDSIHVMKYSGKQADVFFVVTLTKKGGKFQQGRMVKFRYNKWRQRWEAVSSQVMWDDRKKKGNKFPWPPYIGRDKTILLKV